MWQRSIVKTSLQVYQIRKRNNIFMKMSTFDKTTKFKCFKCKDIVSLEDKFNDDLKEDQMCKL